MALERNPNGRRWSKDLVRLCLTLYCRSPRGYNELRGSNFLILPSQNLLRIYKNSVHQEAGVNKDMLEWMANEAKIKNIPPARFQGGLMIDEMSIQPDLQFQKLNNFQLIGFTECTPESIVFDQMKSNKRQKKLLLLCSPTCIFGLHMFPFSICPFPFPYCIRT